MRIPFANTPRLRYQGGIFFLFFWGGGRGGLGSLARMIPLFLRFRAALASAIQTRNGLVSHAAPNESPTYSIFVSSEV